MLSRFKDKLSSISANGLEIPITSSVIEQLIKMKLGLQDVKVKITPESLTIQGTTEVKKLMLKKMVSFRVTLKPIHLDKRTIQFELIDMKPVDINFISDKIFNRPPFLGYADRTIKMDLNALDVVNKIPVGNIKSYEMVEDAINIRFSL
ncbi:hypothetical protein BN1080_02844 [Planococcus massiliensis]|uniref:DUF2993 domain-containing protein n=1 Tax=Planococcus massiliensis TaxID=1499687 RepID=A0A098EPY7_9BACL|nr:hypothetical protein [Planococcus massiliensis]CEG23837.1 hypothetical protein BN1080_02844 [Planococcus massiliensis]